MNFRFSQIFISSPALHDEITRRTLSRYKHLPVETVENEKVFLKKISTQSLSEGKKTLWLTHFKGQFLKPCPGTARSYRCCNYLVINETTNCPIDCSYCILQGYIDRPVITVYTNTDKILQEIESISRLNPGRILRIGTGELTDSLALDPVTGLATLLIDRIQTLPNVLLELKTKTDHIGHLAGLPTGKVILSWSVNPAELVKAEDHKAASLAKRLAAAKKAADLGFKIGWHLDPILHYEGWESGYRNLIRQLAQQTETFQIAWISLGSFRFPPALREIIRRRFPHTPIVSGEQIIGLDGKIRYLKPLRLQMYRVIAETVRQELGNVFIYFCMESDDVWQKVLGRKPKDNLEIDWYFASSLYRNFSDLQLPPPRQELYRKPIFISGTEKTGTRATKPQRPL
jgi:spore photoproduct lyase